MNRKTWCRAFLLSSLSFTSLGVVGPEAFAQESSSVTTVSNKMVVPNEPDQPRATPVTRDSMKQYLEDLKFRSPRIPLPELTPEEKKLATEDPRTYGYEARLRKLHLNETSASNYLPFGGVSKTASTQTPSRSGPVDPKMTLDYAFKVRLFWIAARGNNCQYCLGHQESKLLAAGMTEDQIAALDSDWELFPENERVAFALAKKLTLQPQLISSEDIEACRKHYSGEQLIEMIGSIAGNNAINRWKEGAGIPQSNNGGNFGGQSPTESHSYLTATSDKYAKRPSKVAAILEEDAGNVSLVQSSPTQFQRPPLETGAELSKRLESVKQRHSRLPLVDEQTAREVMGELVEGKPVYQWHRLLANFPLAGKRLATGITTAKESDALSERLKLKMDWVIARQDRAWYAAALALEQMRAAGIPQDQIDLLDREIKTADLSTSDAKPEDQERAILLIARNLAASPIVLTDRQVELAVKLVGPRAVTQAINYTAYRAAFDRITEAAGLGL